MSDFLSECSFETPVAFKSCTQRAVVYAKFFCPQQKRHSLTVKSQQSVSSMVKILFSSRSPAAILFRISLAVVAAIKAMFARWSIAHIREEVFKRVLPSFADSNSAPAIVIIVRHFWIQTALAHALPCSVFLRRFTARYMSVSQSRKKTILWFQVFSVLLAFQTTATTNETLAQAISSDENYISAITNALPINTRSALELSSNPKPLKSLKANFDYLFVTHEGFIS